MQSIKTSKAGFTIVELLIVIVVIAILAAISIVAYNGIQQRAKDSERVTELGSVQKALSLYYIDNGTYPDCGGNPYSPGSPLAGCVASNLSVALVPRYMARFPEDPTNSGCNRYFYAIGYRKTGATTRLADQSANYLIGVNLETKSTPAANEWGCNNITYYEGSSS